MNDVPQLTINSQGLPVAVIAVLWMIFSMVILAFPTNPNPEAGEMNYTAVVFGGWILLCLIYYYLPIYGGINWFTGPISNIDEKSAGHVKSEENSDGHAY